MFRAGVTRGRHQCDCDYVIRGGERRLADGPAAAPPAASRRAAQSVSFHYNDRYIY